MAPFLPANRPIGCERGKLKDARPTFSRLRESLRDNMNILDLSKVLAGTIEDQIAWYQARGLLSQRRNCSSCGTTMNLQRRDDIKDKYR